MRSIAARAYSVLSLPIRSRNFNPLSPDETVVTRILSTAPVLRPVEGAIVQLLLRLRADLNTAFHTTAIVINGAFTKSNVAKWHLRR